MSRYLATALVTALLFSLPLASPSRAGDFHIQSLDELVDISGAWRFQAGDDMAWASPDYNDNPWPSLMVPRDWRKQGYGDLYGYGWYRLKLRFDLKNEALVSRLGRLALRLGKIQSAYEVYAGGQLLGKVGAFPPRHEVVYDRMVNYSIPPDAIDESGLLVIAIRVWREELICECAEGGFYEGDALVGTIDQLQNYSGGRELPSLVLGLLYLVIGVYHLYLFGRNHNLRQYLWFGLLTFAVGIYVIWVSQWKHYIDLPFLWHKKIEYAVLYITPMLGLSMVWRLIEYRPATWMRWYQAIFALLTVVVLLVPNHSVNYLTLDLWQLLAVPVMLGLVGQLMWYAMSGNREARTLLIGMALFVATAINDILITQALVDTPRMVSYGFAAMIMSMAVSLATHYTALYDRLESEVAERTRELIDANSRLLEAARVDVLTGLLNRRGFSERAEEEILRARRTRRGFALMIADIDKFKDVNDRYGHAAGDHVLREVADTLSSQLRDIDVIARWGGEEYVLLLPETGIEGAAVLAEKLRLLIERHRIEFNQHNMHVTMTFGVAAYELSMTLDDCLALADQALYAGKTSGRNTVEIERGHRPVGRWALPEEPA